MRRVGISFIGRSVLWLALSALASGCASETIARAPGADPEFPDFVGPATLLVTPNSKGHPEFVAAIRGARRSVRLTMYHLTDPEVVRALAAAKKRGCEVKVVLDGSSLRAKKFAKAFDQLQAGGVEVRASSPAFSITHEKAMIVDGKSAFITAINLTMAVEETRDFGVVLEDPSIVAEMDRVFKADWKNASEGTGVSPDVSQANLVWSPLNSRTKLVHLVDSARHTISATVENLGDPEIQAALIRAVTERKVVARLIVPACDKNKNPRYNDPFSETLKKAGVQIRTMPHPSTADHPYMHSKMILADDALAYVGSVNFSPNSTLKARELGILFRRPPLLREIESIFERDWKVSLDFPAGIPTDCPAVTE
jgi:phosphatidylserine/phosphatidylglycerophosphate/cardiolipin synthase-like enzyme